MNRRRARFASLLTLATVLLGAAPSPDPDLEAAARFAKAEAWTEAESLATRALERAESTSPPDTTTIERALDLLANERLTRRVSTDSLGIAWASRLVEIRRARVPVDSLIVADSERILGQLLSLAERFPEALARLETAVAIRRAHHADSDSLLAEARLTLGLVQRRARLMPEARVTLADAIASYAPKRAANDLLLARIRLELAGALAAMQESDAARDQYESALPTYRVHYGEGPELGIVYDGLSQLEKNEGNLAQSLEWLERSVDVKTRGYGPDARSTLFTRANLGMRLIEFGDPTAARRCMTPLIAPFEAMLGRGHSTTEQVRTQLGIACLAEGDVAAGKRELDTALVALEARPGDHRSELAWTLQWLARAARMEGDFESARRLNERGLQLAADLAESESAMLVQLHTQQLAILGALGVLDSLPPLIAATDSLLVRWGLSESVFAASTRAEEARAWLRMRRTDEAWAAALTSDDVARRLLIVNAGQLADRHAFSLSGQWNEASPLLARLAAGGKVDATVAWDRAQRWGHSWDRERELRRSPRVSEEKDVVRAHERWVVAEREYGRSIVERMRNGPDDPGDAVSEARTRAERAEADYRAAARLAGVAVPTIEPALPDILASLGADETLLRFAIASNAPDKSEAIVAYVARGRMPVSVVELAPASATFAALDSWRAVLSDSPRARAGAEDECRRAGAAVRSLLWEPLARWVETATIVHVVDASLGGVPWQALPIGESQYLVERGPEVRVHESEAELLRPDPAGLEVRVLAIGNPDFDHSPGSDILLADAGPSDARRGGLETCTPFPQLARLPASELEADEVARILSRDSIVRTGAEADEERFKRDAPGATVIHLATHGVVLADTCAVAGAPGYRGVGGLVPLAAPSSAPSTSSASTTRSTRLPEDAATTPSPWLGRRISLAFAGANHARHADDENDGLLSAEEIATLDLRDADWVVLSACHAGANESWTAEGALGMTRALHLAGARTVIASRWSLEDESTLEFMRELYHARERGVRQGNAALHEACRAVLASRRQDGRTTHPFYWASFTASGD